MLISELIQKLEEIKDLIDDCPVVVKYRDKGGEYDGFDKELYLIFEDNKCEEHSKILFL